MVMRRKLVTFLCVVSLLLCLASGGMWVRSYGTFDRWARGGETYWNVESWRGVLSVEHVSAQPPDRDIHWYMRQTDGWYWRGFALAHRPVHLRQASRHAPSSEEFMSGPAPPGYVAAVPYWLVVILLAVLPVTRLVRLFPRRPAGGVCASCGYDLRATPHRCPECGAAPTAA